MAIILLKVRKHSCLFYTKALGGVWTNQAEPFTFLNIKFSIFIYFHITSILLILLSYSCSQDECPSTH